MNKKLTFLSLVTLSMTGFAQANYCSGFYSGMRQAGVSMYASAKPLTSSLKSVLSVSVEVMDGIVDRRRVGHGIDNRTSGHSKAKDTMSDAGSTVCPSDVGSLSDLSDFESNQINGDGWVLFPLSSNEGNHSCKVEDAAVNDPGNDEPLCDVANLELLDPENGVCIVEGSTEKQADGFSIVNGGFVIDEDTFNEWLYQSSEIFYVGDDVSKFDPCGPGASTKDAFYALFNDDSDVASKAAQDNADFDEWFSVTDKSLASMTDADHANASLWE